MYHLLNGKSLQIRQLWLVIIIALLLLVIQYYWLLFMTSMYCRCADTTTTSTTSTTVKIIARPKITTTEKPDTKIETTSVRGMTEVLRPESTAGEYEDGRLLYIITPTYRRPQQLAELTRLSQTLMLVPNLVWIVVEDEHNKTESVERLLLRTGMPFVHLVAPIPQEYKNDGKNLPRGVSNRLLGLQWVRNNSQSGVLFFADDDNSYDIRLFKEIRSTVRVSMFPVGLLSAGFASPVVKDGKVTGFYEGWEGGRKFPVDMAGFAVSVEFLLQSPHADMPYIPGHEEDGFLKSLSPFSLDDIEVKASNCTEVLVWHTQTRTPPTLKPPNMTQYAGTNVETIYSTIVEEISRT